MEHMTRRNRYILVAEKVNSSPVLFIIHGFVFFGGTKNTNSLILWKELAFVETHERVRLLCVPKKRTDNH